MAAWCLPPQFANKFLQAVNSGQIDTKQLMNMSSQQRRELFGRLIGDEHAEEINANFESKLLLKDQQRGLVSWVNKMTNVTPQTKRDMIDRIMKMDKVLQPVDEQHFLADLAAQKLGVNVTATEAQKIFDATKKVSDARKAMEPTPALSPERRAFGRAYQDLSDLLGSLKPTGQRTGWQWALEVMNLPKTALTGFLHMSAPGVQGLPLSTTSQFWEGIPKMFQYMENEENYRDLWADVIGHPYYDRLVKGKLAMPRVGLELSKREEEIPSSLLEEANQWLKDNYGVPNVYRASSRAFTGYLLHLRFTTATKLLDAARMGGEDISEGSDVVRKISTFVNDFSGRSNLGKHDEYANLSPILNALLFAPRKMLSTVKVFDPRNFLSSSPAVRQAAIQNLFGFMLSTMAVAGLARMSGAKVGLNPWDSDFLTVDIGGQKFGLGGSERTFIRLMSRLAMFGAGHFGMEMPESMKGMTAPEQIWRYFRNSFAPATATITNALYGQDAIGNPFSIEKELYDNLAPITVQEFSDYYNNNPQDVAALFPSLLAFLGVHMDSPLPPRQRMGMTVLGDDAGSAPPTANDPVLQMMEKAGIRQTFPSRTINGVKLSDAEYESYIKNSGRMARQLLEQSLNSSAWGSMPSDMRAADIRATITAARGIAQAQLMMENPNIITESVAAKTKAAAGTEQQ